MAGICKPEIPLPGSDSSALGSYRQCAILQAPLRSFTKYLPAFLTLCLPLLLLAWLGSREFNRLEDRARGIAYKTLGDVHRTVSQKLQDLTTLHLVDTFPDLASGDLMGACREVEQDPLVLELFLLGQKGELLFPRLPAYSQEQIPLVNPPGLADSQDQSLLTAEVLESLGDYAGAANKLQDYVKRNRGFAEHRHGLMHALFALGGLHLRLQDLEAAEDSYFEALVMAEEIEIDSDSRGQTLRDAYTISLLSKVGRAELSDDPALILDVIRDISNGLHDGNPEEIITAANNRLQLRIGPNTPEYQALAGTQADNQTRLAGRRFAREYQHYALDEFERQIATGKQDTRLYQCITSELGSSLLVARLATDSEAQAHDCVWVGLQFDVAAMLSSFMDPFFAKRDDIFSLYILDPFGFPILPAELPKDVIDQDPIERISLANLQLQLLPSGNSEQNLEAAQRNRLLLTLALILLAAGGATFLLRAVRRESELAAMKLDLVSRVSHEFKTPLSVIKMYGETLGMGRAKDQAQVNKFAGIISKEADSLTRMIQRILDFSQQEAGSFTYHKRGANLSEILASVTDEYLPLIESRGANLEARLEPDLRAHIDPLAFTGCVVNLLENALKYSAANTQDRMIQLHLYRKDNMAVLEVMDRGIGIPAAERKTIFQHFYRASTAGEVRGAGLGLSLVAHFVQAHDGSVRCLGRPHGGTIIQVKLPLLASTPNP